MVARPVFLDTGPLGLLTNPKQSDDAAACTRWLRELTANGVRVFVPELSDYELQRKLLHRGKVNGLRRLDELIVRLPYVSITTAVMRKAAELWADARRAGRPTASDDSLGGDVILAAQALPVGEPVIVATTNVGHLSQFVHAAEWQTIR